MELEEELVFWKKQAQDLADTQDGFLEEIERAEKELAEYKADNAKKAMALSGPCHCDPVGSGEEYCHDTCALKAMLEQFAPADSHMVDDEFGGCFHCNVRSTEEDADMWTPSPPEKHELDCLYRQARELLDRLSQ